MEVVSQLIRDKTEAAIRGDAAAMGALFQLYRPRLYFHALRLCGNTPLAQDAVQETFISALTHISSLRSSELFYPWLRKILMNNCLLQLRREKSLQNITNTIHTDSFIQDSIEMHFEKSANRQLMYETLNRLSDELRSCVLLRYFSNFNSYEEIALILGIPIGTVRSRLSAARQKLTALYERLDDSDAKALEQSGQWSDYYRYLWNNVYDDWQVRNELFNHLQPFLDVHFTSGKTGKGRGLIEKAVDEDIVYGTSFNATEISSCGNISVIEGINIHSIEHPHHCPPFTVYVTFREKDKIGSMHIFNSPHEDKK